MKNSKKYKTGSSVIIMIIFLMLSFSSYVYAHRVYLFAWEDGGTIYTESYFSGNKKVQDGIIRVFNMEGKELLSGKTNDAGEFSFRIPEITDLKIVLESSMGHGAEYILKGSEISEGEKIETNNASEIVESIDTEALPDTDQLKRVIDAALDERLKPVIRELAMLREDKGQGVTEIIGGIGYIFGIMGVIAYMQSRHRLKGAGRKA
ncbi:MAG: hypothetical protein GX654_06150 [Desulfatiglans sp.]|jgi:nickel transport protein|nr:hypothetical protein [Desulfatiglans sp.]